MKTRERVQFTAAEDDVIMHCYICNLVLDKKSHDFSQVIHFTTNKGIGIV